MRTIGQLTQKKGKGKLKLFCGNGEQVIPINDVILSSIDPWNC